jgi:hypothetical protein
MSHQRLGEIARAKDYYDWARRWIGTPEGISTERLEELNLFRAEATTQLGIEKKD